MKNHPSNTAKLPSAVLSIIPILALLASLITIAVVMGADYVSTFGPVALLGAAVLAAAISYLSGTLSKPRLLSGLKRSFSDLLPTVGILACIGTVSAAWMLSGIVPTIICYGLDMLNPDIFLFVTCAVCSCVSVLLGSSWTTIATVGMAFLGIGHVLGYSEGWIAGAIISGAYFGDKVSPLSDTTVIASSSCGVDLFTHIRYLMLTAVPTMTIALLVFLAAGFFFDNHAALHTSEIADGLRATFNITPWLLMVPAITVLMCLLRVKSIIVLVVSSLLGVAATCIAQPQVFASIADDGPVVNALHVLGWSTQLHTGTPLVDDLVATGGMMGMVPTITLVICAMVFGGTLIGTGMLQSLTAALTDRLNGPRSVVSATVGTGITLNMCTADQFISLIIGSNLYGKLYADQGLEARLLSRSLEDSISVTSPLVPWNSCGLTQSTVLGVSTLTYLPYCVFNYLQPMMSIVMVRLGYKIKVLSQRTAIAQ